LGERIRFKRKEKGLTQAQAAQIIGVRKPLYGLWELDRYPVTEPQWRSLSVFLGATADRVFPKPHS